VKKSSKTIFWQFLLWVLPISAQAQFNFVTNVDNTITITGYTGSGGNVVIPSSTNGYPVTTIGAEAFFNKTNLTGVTIPNTVTSFGEFAFCDCSGLTSVAIPNSVTNIGGEAFEYCSNLTSVTIGNSLIGDHEFAFCNGLTYVTIPNSVTIIGTYAFYHCSGLTNVTIGNSVTNIGSYAFWNCTNLHQAVFQGNAPSVNGGDGSADDTVFYLDSGTAYFLPSTAGWSDTFGGWPTAVWYQPQPQILGVGYGFGVQSNGFRFTISWATNTAVVAEASTNLLDWTPVSTNTLVNGTNAFGDSTWTNYPQRFYRVRSQ
jgi:hypothetical protein